MSNQTFLSRKLMDVLAKRFGVPIVGAVNTPHSVNSVVTYLATYKNATGKYNSDDCKNMIVDWSKQNPMFVVSQFSNPTPAEQQQMIHDVQQKKNWKRHNIQKDGNVIERCFDCAPLDDQYRAYVIEENGELRLESIGGE